MNLAISSSVSVIFAVTAFSIAYCVSNASDTVDNKPHSITLHEKLKNTTNNKSYNENSSRDKRGFVYVPDRVAPPPSWGSKMFNRFKKRTSSILGATGLGHGSIGSGTQLHDLSNNEYDVADSAAVVDDNEASGAFWNLYSSRGHGGGGYGGGYGSGYGKGVNKSAVGLLGFLSLLSLIQMSLSTTTTTMMGRRKRDINGTEIDEEPMDTSPGSDTDRIMKIVLPLMTAVTSSTKNERVSGVKECILFQMCEANGKLAEQFGDQGVSLGQMISDALGKMLKEVGKGELSSKFRYAGMAGRNRKACRKIYKSCQEMS